jgi:crossover junction endodeoxyribonuclease RuvC
VSTKERIILGVDPGTAVTGYGIIKVVRNKPQILVLGTIELYKLGDHYVKLHRIFERISRLLKEYCPNELAIESPFYGKNVQSMLKLGRAQGVAMAAALAYGIPIYEYAPRKVKMSITGKGAASKEQVAAMLSQIAGLTESPKKFDATDALAVAICHFYQTNKPLAEGKTFNSWKDFINQNPKRIK